MLQKKNEGILFFAEIRVVGSYTDRLLMVVIWNDQEFDSCYNYTTHALYV